MTTEKRRKEGRQRWKDFGWITWENSHAPHGFFCCFKGESKRDVTAPPQCRSGISFVLALPLVSLFHGKSPKVVWTLPLTLVHISLNHPRFLPIWSLRNTFAIYECNWDFHLGPEDLPDSYRKSLWFAARSPSALYLLRKFPSQKERETWGSNCAATLHENCIKFSVTWSSNGY